jgi:hypothetical protein
MTRSRRKSADLIALPFTYLGLPVGTTRPTIQDLSPLVDRIERQLNATARFLPYGGRLLLVNSVLSSLPTHYMCSLKIHKTVIKIFDRSRRHCLWAKKEDGSYGQSLAAWELVCRPKNRGGMGIINLELQNEDLLLKQLHKFYSRADVPWVHLVWSYYDGEAPHASRIQGSFWWRDVMSSVSSYRSITKGIPGDGSSVLLWKDFWSPNIGLLADRFQRLFSFSLHQDITVAVLSSCGSTP